MWISKRLGLHEPKHWCLFVVPLRDQFGDELIITSIIIIIITVIIITVNNNFWRTN